MTPTEAQLRVVENLARKLRQEIATLDAQTQAATHNQAIGATGWLRELERTVLAAEGRNLARRFLGL